MTVFKTFFLLIKKIKIEKLESFKTNVTKLFVVFADIKIARIKKNNDLGISLMKISVFDNSQTPSCISHERIYSFAILWL